MLAYDPDLSDFAAKIAIGVVAVWCTIFFVNSSYDEMDWEVFPIPSFPIQYILPFTFFNDWFTEE